MSSHILLSLVLWTLLTGVLTLVADSVSRKRQLTPGVWWCILIAPCVALLPIPDVLLQHARYAGSADLAGLEPVVWVADNITTPLQQPWAMSWSQVVMALVALVSLLKLLLLARHYQAVLRLAQQSRRWPEALNPEIIKGHVDCVLLPADAPSTSAFVIGLRRPCIVLPNRFLQLSQQQQQMILAHELNHIRFRDHWCLVIWHSISALAWFNPFLAKLSAQYSQAVEMRCDAATIAGGRFCPNAYARALIDSLKQSLSGASGSDTTALQLSFSSQGMAVAAYKQRIRAVLGSGPERLSWRRLAPVFLLLLVAMLFARSAYSWALSSTVGHWIMPVAEPAISSSFGHVAIIRQNQVHQGVDFKGPVGTPIYASAAGRVIVADATSLSPDYGKVVVIQHGDGWQTLYAHLDSIEVQQGSRVRQGEVVGTMGATGKVTGSHLHFELLQDGQRQDPMAYLEHAGNKEGE